MSAGKDGKLYFQAAVYCLPKDRRYSYRLQSQHYYAFDTCFMRLDQSTLRP